MLTPTRRRWLYRVSIAAIPLGIALGILDAKTAALVAPLLVALLNVPGSEPGDPVQGPRGLSDGRAAAVLGLWQDDDEA